MPANRETRRRNPKKQKPQAPATPTLEQLAAATSAPEPLIINLDNCRVVIRDVQSNQGAVKELLFAHASGGVIFRAVLAPALCRELATLLSAPPGIVIPNGMDTPAA